MTQLEFEAYERVKARMRLLIKFVPLYWLDVLDPYDDISREPRIAVTVRPRGY